MANGKLSGGPLISLPIDEARRLKWVRFRERAGIPPDAPFQGDPVIEVYEEFLDALNYLDAIPEQTEAVRDIRAHVMAAAYATWNLWRERATCSACTPPQA